MKRKIYIIAVLGFIFDQISKVLVTSFMNVYSSITVVNNFFSITYIRNKGAAWGIFSDSTLILAIVSLVFLFFLIKYIEESKNMNNLNIVSLGLILGGLAGNLIDRLIKGYVVDFFSFVIFGYHYPIFNVADILIVIGVILFVVDYVLGDGKNGKGKA